MLIRTVEMENFKAFKKFSMMEGSDFKRFTLVGGGNNMGKTSLLEGLFLYHDIFDLRCFFNYHRRKGIQSPQLKPENLWGQLVYKFDHKILSSICVNKEFSINFQIFPYNRIDWFQDNTIHIAQDISHSKNTGYLDLKISDNHENIHFQYIINPQDSSQTCKIVSHSNHYQDLIVKRPTVYSVDFSKNGAPNDLANWRSNIKQANIQNEQKVLDFLNLINTPKILGIETLTFDENHEIMLFLEGFSKPMPLSYMGTGSVCLLTMILALMTTDEPALCLFDELGTGLHYSILPKVMKALAVTAQKLNKQIIATTHSYECLEAAVEGLKDEPNLQEEFGYVRLDQVPDKEGHIEAVSYEYELFSKAIERQWEVRS